MPPAEKIFLEDCHTKCVSPIVLETFKNAKIAKKKKNTDQFFVLLCIL